MERHEKVAVIAAKFFNESRDVNPYASADTMRALDHIIRNGLADGLARAAAGWRSVYQQQSRLVGTPTRDNPFPDAKQMAAMREYKRMSDTISEWVSRIHALEAPSNDRVYHRIREHDQLLELLIAADYQLATLAEAMDRLAETTTLENAADMVSAFDARLKVLSSAINERSRMLSAVP